MMPLSTIGSHPLAPLNSAVTTDLNSRIWTVLRKRQLQFPPTTPATDLNDAFKLMEGQRYVLTKDDAGRCVAALTSPDGRRAQQRGQHMAEAICRAWLMLYEFPDTEEGRD